MPSPEVSDYPPLHDWLNKHDARCIWYVSDWERGVKKPLRHVEAWLVRGALVLVVLYAERRGWHVYTEANTTNIVAVFADIERRIGVADPGAHPDPITNAAELATIALLDGPPSNKVRYQIEEDPTTKWARLGRTATAETIRDEIIRSVGMMADARTPAMQAAYDAALAREGKIDSPAGPITADSHFEGKVERAHRVLCELDLPRDVAIAVVKAIG